MSFDFEVESVNIFLDDFNNRYGLDFQIDNSDRKIDDDVDITAESKSLNKKIYIQIVRVLAEINRLAHYNNKAPKDGKGFWGCTVDFAQSVINAVKKKAASYPKVRQKELILLIVDEFSFARNSEITSVRLFNQLPENSFRAIYLISRPQGNGKEYVLLLQRTDLLDELREKS